MNVEKLRFFVLVMFCFSMAGCITRSMYGAYDQLADPLKLKSSAPIKSVSLACDSRDKFTDHCSSLLPKLDDHLESNGFEVVSSDDSELSLKLVIDYECYPNGDVYYFLGVVSLAGLWPATFECGLETKATYTLGEQRAKKNYNAYSVSYSTKYNEILDKLIVAIREDIDSLGFTHQ